MPAARSRGGWPDGPTSRFSRHRRALAGPSGTRGRGPPARARTRGRRPPRAPAPRPPPGAAPPATASHRRGRWRPTPRAPRASSRRRRRIRRGPADRSRDRGRERRGRAGSRPPARPRGRRRGSTRRSRSGARGPRARGRGPTAPRRKRRPVPRPRPAPSAAPARGTRSRTRDVAEGEERVVGPGAHEEVQPGWRVEDLHRRVGEERLSERGARVPQRQGTREDRAHEPLDLGVPDQVDVPLVEDAALEDRFAEEGDDEQDEGEKRQAVGLRDRPHAVVVSAGSGARR